MAKGLIRLSHRLVIDAASVKTWERAVFAETHREFFMQAQALDPQGQYPTLAELLAGVPGADRLHYLVSRVAVPYLKDLNGVIPGVLNTAGAECLPFEQFRFEILASHGEQPAAHRVAITFFSDPLTWVDTVGDRLLVAVGDQREALRGGQAVNTHLIAPHPGLNLWSFQPETVPQP